MTIKYEKVLSENTCYPGLFATKFSMVNLDLSSIQKKIAEGTAPFKKLIKCNLGNPLGVGQKEITFVRQLIAACLAPNCFDSTTFPADVCERAKKILAACPGGNSGSYQATQGIDPIVHDVAEYITARDGYKTDKNSICLMNGATEAILSVMRPIIRSQYDAVLTPKPGFPMYGASISYYGGKEVMYELDEEKNWGFSRANLDAALDECRKKGLVPRAIVLTNPSNPTGAVQTRQNIIDII